MTWLRRRPTRADANRRPGRRSGCIRGAPSAPPRRARCGRDPSWWSSASPRSRIRASTQHEIEGVLRAPAVGRGVGERTDDLQEFDDRGGPAVGHEQRQRVRMTRADDEAAAVAVGVHRHRCLAKSRRGLLLTQQLGNSIHLPEGGIRDDLWVAGFQHGDQRVGRAQVDTDRLGRAVLPSARARG